MPVEAETVTTPQQNSEETQNEEQLVQVVSDNDDQPQVQEDACVLKSKTVEEETDTTSPLKPSGIKSPISEATKDFLANEKSSYVEVEPSTPANSDAEESVIIEPEPPLIVDVSYNEKEIVNEVVLEEPIIELNGHRVEESVPVEVSAPVIVEELAPVIVEESAPVIVEEPAPVVLEESVPIIEIKLSNGNAQEEFNGECKFEPKIVEEPEEIKNGFEKPALNGTIASELPDYKLPDVVEVKKNFEFVAPTGHNLGHVPPKKGALSTTIDSQGVRQAYQDVRNDGSETQWAIFKFEGPTILTSATGADFDEFKKHFGEDDRAFAYIRVQTGDEMSRRAKFLFFTWVGPNVSVLKRAKMSTDKALIKDIVSNFAVELQTENLTDITLQNFETELDKASGAHYGTGIRS